MDWKDVVVIAMALGVVAIATWTGRCPNELTMVCATTIGGVFGRATAGRLGARERRTDAEPAP